MNDGGFYVRNVILSRTLQSVFSEERIAVIGRRHEGLL
ncbi:MAG: hypothetical protein RL021_1667, partial [Bacteroidota bacterium]